MKISMITVAATILALTFVGCGSDSDDDDEKDPTVGGGPGGTTANSKTLTFISLAANSLPQIKSGTTLVGNISDNTSLAQLFKQECYMPSSDGESYEGFCPADVVAELNAAIAAGDGVGDDSPVFNKYKLTTTGTLIGLVYHAQMYSQGPGFTNVCADYEAEDLATEHSPEFLGGSDPDKFIIDYFDVLSCVKANTWDGNTTYATFGYNDNDEAPAVANLTARYGLPYGSDLDSQTDIFQVYLGMDADTAAEAAPTPTFLGFNFAQASGLRAIVLANLTTHQFAVRSANASQQVMAIGTGGVDQTSGTAVTGYYMAKDITSGSTYCVDNETGDYDVGDYSDCATDINFWDTISGAEVADYLGMNAEDEANMAGFLAFFGDTDLLDAAAFPSTNYTADKEFFPQTIQ